MEVGTGLALGKRYIIIDNIDIFHVKRLFGVDTELARTFLSVVAEGSFLRASKRLHVTQSTISVRIRVLEEEFGSQLLVRNKSGVTLTAAGHRFQRHAHVILQTLERARHDVGVAEGFGDAITIGARIGLWDGFLSTWLGDVRRSMPELAFRTRTGFEDDLMPALAEGSLDIGVMYTPQHRPGLEVEELFNERLVMVTTQKTRVRSPDADHVLVDWGPEFYARFRAAFPAFAGSALSVSVGWLGLQHLKCYGGSGYFPHRLVKSQVQRKELFAVKDAPEFELPAFLVYSKNFANREIGELVLSLRAEGRRHNRQ